jgi:hypothetical protein
MTVSVKDEDWEALVGAILKEETDDLNVLLTRVDEENSLTRYYLYIKWQDAGAKRPAPGDEITDWPPWRFAWFISYTQFTEEFVTDYVDGQTDHALAILVTDDPSGEVGWFTVEDFFS